MKKSLLLSSLFLFIIKGAFAQKDTVGLHIPFSEGTVVYEKVFDAPGKSKADLYSSAQLWFITHYKGDRDILAQDSIAGKIVGKGKEIVNWEGPVSTVIPFNNFLTIQIDCKDSKYRIRMYNMHLIAPKNYNIDGTETTPEDMVNLLTGQPTASAAAFNKKQATRMLESLNITINNTMASLYKTMTDNDDF